jgi:hypothetical protein
MTARRSMIWSSLPEATSEAISLSRPRRCQVAQAAEHAW